MHSSFIDFSDQISKETLAFFVFNQNKNFILKNIGFSSDDIAVPDQTHSINVKYIDKPGKYNDTDGLITDNPEIILILKVADCVPIYLYESRSQIIGLIHSGWRGTLHGIVPNTIHKMIELGAHLNNINIFLGPSICFNCYEVDEEVANNFQKISKRKIKNKKWKISLHQQIRTILIDEGVEESKIRVSTICTYESSTCHSYRRDGVKSGRMLALMGLKNELS